MPAYRAEATLRKTYEEVVASGVVDKVIVVDDASCDQTVAVARSLPGVLVEVHERNRGYGANQKTCYRVALAEGADIVVMVHPDYQYTPRLIPAMVAMIESGHFECVLGSRILGGGAIAGGMPYWKYVSNRYLTWIQNLLFGSKISEFHTGYRAYSRRLLERLPLSRNSDDFVFDCQILAQILWLREPIGELSCPTKYESESSSIGFRRSVVYGIGCLRVGLQFRLARFGLTRFQLLTVQ